MDDVVLHEVNSIAGHNAAYLAFLSETEYVRNYIEVLVGPHFSSQPEAGLHLIENEQGLLIICNPSEVFEKFFSEMVVAALSLDGLNNDGRDPAGMPGEAAKDVLAALRLSPGDPLSLKRVRRKANLWIGDSGPVKLWKEVCFFGGGIRQRKCVAAAPVKCLLEMKNLVAWAGVPSGLQVQPRFPVKGCLQGVFYRQGSALNKKQVTERIRHCVAGKGLGEAGQLKCMRIGIGGFVYRCFEKTARRTRLAEDRMVEAQGKAGKKCIEVEVFGTVPSIGHPRSMTFSQVEYDVVSIANEMLAQKGGKAIRVYSVFHRNLRAPCISSSSDA